MKKQDGAGYRTPLDVARRYKLGDINLNSEEIEQIKQEIVCDTQLSLTSEAPVQNKIITAGINSKVTKETGKGLSSNDYTDSDKAKVHDHSNKAVLDEITQQKINQWDSNSFSIDTVYPVGSIYISTVNTNPSVWLTGTTWEQIKDTFLLSAGDTYTAGATGGEATHTLTTNEMPSHKHSGLYYNSPSTSTAVTLNSGSKGYKMSWTGSWSETAGAGSGSAELVTGEDGGGQAHNNMPPYLVVYMFKRTS